MKYDYDVIIVGSRVAGASTAMLLARRGHRVLVVDRASMPSDTVSTHAVLRTGVLQLSRWGVLDRIIEAGTPPVRQITLGFGDDRIPFEVKSDYGIDTLYAPRRYILDSALTDAAREAGADVRHRTGVTDLVRDENGRVEGVSVRTDGGRESITARFVIGADGYNSRVAALVGAPARAHHKPHNAVHYAYYDGVEAKGFWFQFTPGVNAGLVPTNDGQCLVFVGRPAQLRHRFIDDPDGEFQRLLRVGGDDLLGVVAAGRRASGFRGTKGLEGFIRQAWGPGWALVGDAGYTKDPISAHGISDSLRDAELCARAVDAALCDREEAENAMSRYQTLRDMLSRRIFAESGMLARFEWTAPEASRRMRVISSEVRAECEAILELPEWSPVDSTMAGV